MVHRGKCVAGSAAWLALLAGFVSFHATGFLGATAWAGPSAAGREGHRLTTREPGKPAYLWLWYADGKAIPEYAEYCGDLAAPPAYQCNFGTSLQDCQVQVQAYLDAWYKDFNLLFTLTRPPSGDYYTVVITSGWPQCATEAADLTGGSASTEGGIAPGTCGVDNVLQTAVAIECGKNAHDCATLIAHEHGHLVGLVHTTGGIDVMNASVQSSAEGFSDKALSAVQDRSNTCAIGTQNSYQRMLTALTAWPGGSKPSIFSTAVDAGVSDAGDAGTADAGPDAPADAQVLGGGVGPALGPVDADLTVLGGYDAYSRGTLVIPDAGAAVPAAKSSGCSVVQTSGSRSFLLLAAALLAYRWRRGLAARG